MQTFNPTPLQNFGASGTPSPSPTPEQNDMQWSPHHSNMGGHSQKDKNRIFILIVVVILFILFIVVLVATGKSRAFSKLQASAYETTPAAMKTDDGSIAISTPQNGAILVPPFTILGQAKGYWFNQGLFPVTIYDTDKKVVMKTYAIAQADWNQVDAMVPFKVTVDGYDTQPTKKQGHIVFKKANTASGVNDSEYLVVVEFGKKAAAIKTATTGTKTTTTTGTTPACRDDKDNDGDGLVDSRDPGCHTDTNAGNISTYEINKTSEVNVVVTPTPTPTPTTPPTGTAKSCYPNNCAINNPKNYNGSVIVPDGTPLNAFGFPQV